MKQVTGNSRCHNYNWFNTNHPRTSYDNASIFTGKPAGKQRDP